MPLTIYVQEYDETYVVDPYSLHEQFVVVDYDEPIVSYLNKQGAQAAADRCAGEAHVTRIPAFSIYEFIKEFGKLQPKPTEDRP